MTLLLVLRNEVGDTSTATDGYAIAYSDSTPAVVYAYQHNVSASSPSTPSVTPTVEQTITTSSKSMPMIWHEIS